MSGEISLKKKGRALHERLVAGDSQAETEIAEFFLPLLMAALKRTFPQVTDPHLVEQVAIDSIIAYLKQPRAFDPDKSSLIGYLFMDAERDLINLLRKNQNDAERQRRAIEAGLSDADQSPDPEAQLLEADSPLLRRMREIVKKPLDLEMFELILDGVRDSGPYAELLGIQAIPLVEQAVIVKRHKDRLKAMVRRAIDLRRYLVFILGLLAALRDRVRAAGKLRTALLVLTAVILVGSSVLFLHRRGAAPVIATPGLTTQYEIATSGLVEKIFFASNRAAKPGTLQAHIWMMNPDGTQIEQVTFGDVDDQQPDVSPDGTKLAFNRKVAPRNPNEGQTHIWVRDLPSGVEIPVTVDADEAEGYTSGSPVWSRDGSRLAVQRDPVIDDGPWSSVWLVDFLPGIGEPVRLTPELRFGRSSPEWAPDGKSVLFMIHVIARDGPMEIHKIGVDSHIEEQVIPLVTNEYTPKCSPAGDLAWISFRDADQGADIYTAKLADPLGSQRRLTPESGWQDAAWSPDGKRLAMVKTKYRLTDQSLIGLRARGLPEWVVRDLAAARTEDYLSHREIMTRMKEAIGEDATAAHEYRILQHALWRTEIWTAQADGTHFVQLTSGPASDSSVSWARAAFIEPQP